MCHCVYKHDNDPVSDPTYFGYFKMTVVIENAMAEAEVNAIGISFGNSNSSIAYTTGVRDELQPFKSSSILC